MNPIISIIVPVYNDETYLRNCLDSIRSQLFTNIEVIVVNDGSTDKSGEIGEAYAKKDGRINVIHQASSGVSAARNTGVQAASGKYIGFVDGDDYIDASMYETLYQLCKDTESDIAVCKLGREVDGKIINADSNSTYVKTLSNEQAMRELFTGKLYRFSLCNKLFKRKCFRGVKFPEGRIHEDLATTYKLFANAGNCVYTNYIGYIYVKRRNSILTANYYEKRLDAFIAWDEIIPFMQQNYKDQCEEVYARFGYWCVDDLYVVLNKVDNRNAQKTYLGIIRKFVHSYYDELKNGRFISQKYKKIFFLIQHNLKALIMLHSIKRTLRKGHMGIRGTIR